MGLLTILVGELDVCKYSLMSSVPLIRTYCVTTEVHTYVLGLKYEIIVFSTRHGIFSLWVQNCGEAYTTGLLP